MKKWILTTICAAGLIVPALAQTGTNEMGPNDMPDDTNNPQMPGPDQAPSPDMSPAPDQGVPIDQGTPDQTAPPAPIQSSVPFHTIMPRPTVPVTSSQTAPSAQSTANPTQPQSVFIPPANATGSNPDELRLNFDNVPLNEVLNYLSDAAGFVVILDTQVRGNVSVIANHPMTRNEAVDLLNSVLNQNGYAAIRNGNTLTIMDKNDAKTRDIPVQVGNNPASIPKNDEIVTQIIPIRYVDASQLVSDLSSFVSAQATIVANQAGNSIVVTDTQENIRHLVEIISAIDSSAAGETEIQVFHMNYANPNDVASELGNMFPSSSSPSGGQLPIRFGGGPGGFGGGGGFFSRMMAANAAAGGGGNNNNRAQKQSQVTAVADQRTQSVIVMASKDLMPEIAGMMDQLDVPSTRDQKTYTFTLHNADPQEVAQILQSTFGGGSTSGTSRTGGAGASGQSTENSALITREVQGATTSGQLYNQISSGQGNGTGVGRGGGGGGAP